jgi:Peptidase A4 family/Bacterial Ig-like domain (group 3)
MFPLSGESTMSWFTRKLGGRARAAIGSARKSQQARLFVEEFEGRLVPSSVISTTSSNWSGYAVETNPDEVTAVSGSWVVPSVTGSSRGTTVSSAWVGIDGAESSTVEQTGTTMEVVNGKASYYAWYEMYPAASVPISGFTVHPGDTINASVTYSTSTGKFTLSITDGKESFTTTQVLRNAQLSSAEWIAEAPTSNGGQDSLANFGSFSFTNAKATINGASGTITDSAAAWTKADATIYKINMESQSGTLEATTSALTSTGAGFTETYDPTGGSGSPPVSPPPAPPVSPPPPPPTTTGSGRTVSTLTAVAEPRSWVPTVEFVDTISAVSGSALPTGTVDILSGNTIIGTARIVDVNGVAEVMFDVSFNEIGVYDISVYYPGSGSFGSSTSDTIVVTVT